MNFDHLPLLLLAGIFVLAAVAIWVAGTQLSNTTDALDKRFGLGQALGGMVVLAIVTNLPEIAITVSASLQGNVELAVGNILGGIAIQTVVLVALDVFGLKNKGSLTSKITSLQPALEGILVIAVLSLVVLGHQLPSSLHFLRMTPITLLIFFCWIMGLLVIRYAKKGLPWQLPKNDEQANSKKADNQKKEQHKNKTLILFLFAALVTLVAGVALEKSGDVLASKMGLQGIVFGATILAAATSLPELSTGLASIKNKDYELAVSDIFGGNSFLPVLFLVAAICSGKPVLPSAHKSDLYLTSLGILLTLVYVGGNIIRPKKQIARMGIDSFIVLILYIAGAIGLFVLS